MMIMTMSGEHEMETKHESYYLSADEALSFVAKSININIDINKNEIDSLFKQYDRNNLNDTIKMKNFFLSLGLVLQEVHFHSSEDLLNEALPIILLTAEMHWMVCVGGGNKLKLITAEGHFCEVEMSAESLALLSAFRLQPLQKVVDGIRVANILKQALSANKIFYTKYFFSSFFMALFALTIPIFSNLYYDKLVPSASTSSLFGIVFIAALFIIFEFILRSSKDIYQSITSIKDDVDIDISFLEAVIYNKKKNGRSMSSAFVLWNEFQKIKPALLNTIFQRLADIPLFFIFIVVIYVNLGWVVVIPIFMFFFSLAMALINYHYTYSLMNKQKEGQKNRNVFMTEIFYSIKMIHTLNNKNLLLDWVNSSNEQSYLNLKIRKFTLFYQSLLASLSSVSHISIMVIAFFMVINGSVTTGAIVSSVIVSGRISGIISNFSATVVSLLSAEKTAKDLIAFFEDEKKESQPTLQSIASCTGHIALMGVSYQYNPQSPVVISNLWLMRYKLI
ncbi:putative type-1 secretion protein [Candidatus Regiella insecticola LSR1]|uniref:Putative type-1 secretion protein n=1 Tax=Candidatus Regiella insecticola LSR1 TaxID=663321 RepID=E0WR82_9ENTR|nr:putative type-1 secretion protein [Candidatus Regiella insecticola LSR1]